MKKKTKKLNNAVAACSGHLFFFHLLQVHRRVNPFQLQQEACGPAADGAAVGHLDPGPGRGFTNHFWHQQRARPRPQRV